MVTASGTSEHKDFQLISDPNSRNLKTIDERIEITFQLGMGKGESRAVKAIESETHECSNLGKCGTPEVIARGQ